MTEIIAWDNVAHRDPLGLIMAYVPQSWLICANVCHSWHDVATALILRAHQLMPNEIETHRLWRIRKLSRLCYYARFADFVLKKGLRTTCMIFKFSPQLLCNRLARYGHFWLASFITRKGQYAAAGVICGVASMPQSPNGDKEPLFVPNSVDATTISRIWPLSMRGATTGTPSELLKFCRWAINAPQYYCNNHWEMSGIMSKTGDLELCTEYLSRLSRSYEHVYPQNMIMPTLIANKDRARLKGLRLQIAHMYNVIDTGDLDFIKWAVNEQKDLYGEHAPQDWQLFAQQLKSLEIADWLMSNYAGKTTFYIPKDPKITRKYIANLNNMYYSELSNHPREEDEVYTWNNIMCLDDNYSIEDIKYILDSERQSDCGLKYLLATKPFDANADTAAAVLTREVVKRFIASAPTHAYELLVEATKKDNAPLVAWLSKLPDCTISQTYNERLVKLVSGPYEALKAAIDSLLLGKAANGQYGHLTVIKMLSKLSLEMKKKATLLCDVGLLTPENIVQHSDEKVLHWYLSEYLPRDCAVSSKSSLRRPVVLRQHSLGQPVGEAVFQQLLNNKDNWQMLYSRDALRYTCALISEEFCKFVAQKWNEIIFVRLVQLHQQPSTGRSEQCCDGNTTASGLLGDVKLRSGLCDKLSICGKPGQAIQDHASCAYHYYECQASCLWDLFGDFAAPLLGTRDVDVTVTIDPMD